MNMIFYKEPDLDGVFYPTSAKVLSWLIAMFPMSAMLFMFLYEYCYVSGGYEVIIEEKAHAGNATQNIHPPLVQKTLIHLQPHTLHHRTSTTVHFI